MRHLFLKVLFLIAGVALSIYLTVYFEVHTVLIAWFTSVREVVTILVRTFLFRRILRPLWMTLIRTMTVLLGTVLTGKMRKWFFGPLVLVEATVVALWTRLPFLARIGIAGLAMFVLGIIGWGLYLIPVLIPFAAPIIRKLHFWGFDRVFDRWTHPVRMWSKRTYRRSTVLRWICGPYRRSETIAIRWLRKKKRERATRKH